MTAHLLADVGGAAHRQPLCDPTLTRDGALHKQIGQPPSPAYPTQDHFFGFAFFTVEFLAPFFALLFPLPMSALAAR